MRTFDYAAGFKEGVAFARNRGGANPYMTGVEYRQEFGSTRRAYQAGLYNGYQYVLKRCQRANGSYLYHIILTQPHDSRIEDPSVKLGR